MSMSFRVGQKVWKDIAGYEDRYRVSSDGEIFSILSDLILKGTPSLKGYLTVALHKDGQQETRLIHRLVAEAFIENPEAKPSVNHIDSCRANNGYQNLEWCTPAENTQHGVACGFVKGAPRKLTSFQVEQARSLYAEGFRMKWIADRLGVSTSTIKNVMRGKFYPFSGPSMLKPSKVEA